MKSQGKKKVETAKKEDHDYKREEEAQWEGKRGKKATARDESRKEKKVVEIRTKLKKKNKT